MPRRTKRQKTVEEEHTHLAIRLERWDASVEAAINYNVYVPESAWNSDADDPLYRFAYSDEAGHRFRFEAGQSFRFHSGRC
ncbi:MAG: hypothetical protein EOQ57_19480, partial [Mesorhizobium sp.]|uniref:hypothetical protein n=1 Tax=Mesorhizobium sp. TaxID=1871066 RepID=UPI000FE5CB6B